MVALTAFLALVSLAAPQRSATTGTLAGCASDATQRLAGVTVVAKTARVERTTVADAEGCYELRGLPVGSLRVTARLSGYDNVTRDNVAVPPSGVVRIDFAMRPSPICECIRMGGTTLAEQWQHAHAVLHVRLSAAEPQTTTPVGYYRHAATVLSVLKNHVGPLTTPVFVVQNQQSGTSGPYDIGQELVLFLKSEGSPFFFITNDQPGLAVPPGSKDHAVAFLVQDGRIQRAPSEFAGHVGIPLDAFLEELRRLPGAR